MRRFFIPLLCAALWAQTSLAADQWFRLAETSDDGPDTSVTIGPICVPDTAGTAIAAVDYNTTSLDITVAAAGKGVLTMFDYTGGDIDDGPTDFSWGNPTTDAAEIDAIATGALTGCVILSLRDEVFAVTGATEWIIAITDGQSALSDWVVQVSGLTGSSDAVAATASALATYDGPTHTELTAELATADDAVLAVLGSPAGADLATDISDVAGDLSSLANEVGTAGDGLTDLPAAADVTTLVEALVPVSGTADSGTTTSLTDSELTQATDNWFRNGTMLVITGGTGGLTGQSACVDTFTASSDTISFSPPMTAALQSGDTYSLIPASGCVRGR